MEGDYFMYPDSEESDVEIESLFYSAVGKGDFK